MVNKDEYTTAHRPRPRKEGALSLCPVPFSPQVKTTFDAPGFTPFNNHRCNTSQARAIRLSVNNLISSQFVINNWYYYSIIM